MDEITITKLQSFDEKDVTAMNALLSQLDPKAPQLTKERLQGFIDRSGTTIFIARDTNNNEVVGMLTFVMWEIMAYGMKGYLEDMVVDQTYRGRGIGKSMLQETIRYAKEKGAVYIDFTSRPSREEANNLYVNLGFEKRETNVYRLRFTDHE